jgi:ATP-binding cassette subfamily B protein
MWMALTIGLSCRYFQWLRKWTLMRLDMTHDLVERMVGHRTRLAQESASRRTIEEDQTLQDYLITAKDSDDSIIPIVGALSRGWLIIGVLGLAPAFISGSTTGTALAISLGGILLASRALSGVAGGLAALARAGIAWTQVSSLFYSADRKPTKAPFLTSAMIAGTGIDNRDNKLIDASDLVFRYRTQGDPVLQGINLSIFKGERILLEGPSGGGKSTLASMLVGLRTPDSGLLLLNGLDSFTLGESWHRLATEAPQFHENYILTATLAFNLLMGRNWPASTDDLDEAKSLCVDLGLGELLERMPSGMMQRVGETGWQLSHGERSRIFLARALLQNTQLTILDESFAALDPDSLNKCLCCAFKRAKTLLVIAHP